MPQINRQSTRVAVAPPAAKAVAAANPAPKTDAARAPAPLDGFKELGSTRAALQTALRATDEQIKFASSSADVLGLDMQRRIMASDVEQVTRLAGVVADIPGFKDCAQRVEDAHAILGQWKARRTEEQEYTAQNPGHERITKLSLDSEIRHAEYALAEVSKPLRELMACNQEARVRAEPELTGRSTSGGPYESALALRRSLLITRAQLLKKLDE